MTLKILPTGGHAAWWVWSILDDSGTSVELSTTQFRSPEDAARHGYARIAELKDARPRRRGLE